MNTLRSHHLSAVVRIPDAIMESSAVTLLAMLRDVVDSASLTAMSWAVADFEPQGASVVILLRESHVAIHVWPEFGKMTVDVHICDFSADNIERARAVAEALSFGDLFPENRDSWTIQTVDG